jgi:hypothetical protein
MHADPSVDTLGFCFWTHSQGAFPPPRWGHLIFVVDKEGWPDPTPVEALLARVRDFHQN